MTPEQREAELIEGMHTGWANGSAPDLEYMPIVTPLPELVRAEELAALREEYSRLYVMWENAMATVRAERARVAELERQINAVPVGAIAEMLPGSNPRPAALVRQWIDSMIAECQP